MSKNYILKAEPGSFVLTGGDARFKLHEPLPDNHPFYQLVGQVTSEWSHLEHALDLIIWDMTKIAHTDGSCITAQIMGATPRFYTIIALATSRGIPEKTIEEVRAIMQKTFDVQEQRNRVIHDPWYLEKVSEQPAQFKSMPKKELSYGMKDIEEKTLRDLIARIRRRRESISALWNKLCLPKS